MKKLFLSIITVGLLAGCAGTDTEIIPEKTLHEIYDQAYEQFNDENY